MAAKKSNENLGYLGDDTQYQIVKALIEDEKFFRQVYSILDQNAFTVVSLKKIVTLLKDIWKEKGIVPTYKEIEVVLSERAKDDVEVGTIKTAITQLKFDRLLEGLDTVKGVAFRFFAQQEFVSIFNRGLDDIRKNGYVEGKTIPKLQEMINNIGKMAVSDDDKNESVIDLFDSIMSKSEDDRVKTGVRELDSAMNGGLPKKSVGLLIAKTGAGKTSLGTIFCAGASTAGHNVVQIFFEESKEEIGAKHFAYHTGRYTKEFNNKADKMAVWNELKQNPEVFDAMKNNIILKRMENGSTTVEDIRDYLKHLIASGFKPDMVFIDYFSCLQTSSDRRVMYSNESKAGEMAMKKIEQMAYDLDIAVWVAEQTNRTALKKESDFEKIGTVQGSYRITQPASFILFLERAEDREDYNSANLRMDKCRGCEPRKWNGIHLNNGNLQISFGESVSEQNIRDIVTKVNEDFTTRIVNSL